MEIAVISLAGAADTAAQGEAVFNAVREPLQRGDIVTINFGGVRTATSSFVNTAFVALLGSVSFEHIRAHLRIIRSSKQINDMIRTRLEREAAKAGAAAA